MTKSGREIMEIFEAYDLTGTAWSAAQLAGCDAKTVARYVEIRDAGGNPLEKAARPRMIDPYLEKIEEWVDRSEGKVRGDVVHRKVRAMGYRGPSGSRAGRSRTRSRHGTPAAAVTVRGSASRRCGCRPTGVTAR